MLYSKVQGDSSEFMGKTFQAAQLTHERFLQGTFARVRAKQHLKYVCDVRAGGHF